MSQEFFSNYSIIKQYGSSVKNDSPFTSSDINSDEIEVNEFEVNEFEAVDFTMGNKETDEYDAGIFNKKYIDNEKAFESDDDVNSGWGGFSIEG